jgi:membrane dipeptidase
VRRVAGVEHVGVATDLAGLAGFTAIATYPDFAPVPAALLARGWPDADVAAVLGGNAVRLLAAVTGAARG